MRGCHVESAVFDNAKLVSCGGFGPVVALAQRCGLAALVGADLTLPDRGGANADLKVPALVAGWSPAPIRSLAWRCCGMAG